MPSHTSAPPQRRFTFTRIAALVLIAAVAAGLGYLRANRGHGSVTVPAGAHAGQISMKPCRYETEKGSIAAYCGTLVVPENRADPRSRLIALPVTRIRARAEHPGAAIFRLEGGPGITNMDFANASRFNDGHDVILVGYRGVDGSSVLSCPEVTSVLRSSADALSTASFDERGKALRSCATRLRDNGADLAGYTLPQRVDDLEAARRALHYGGIDLLSESAGTRTAMIYSWRYPRSIHRSVMLGANPPGHFLWNAADTDQQLRQYSAQAQGGDPVAAMRGTIAHTPDHWGFLPIKPGNVRVASFLGLFEASSGPLTAPRTFDAWRAAADGDASGLWAMSMMTGLLTPRAQVWGDVAAVGRADAAAAQRHFSADRGSGTALGDAGSDFIWAGGEMTNSWPANADDNAYSRVRTSRVETLVVSGSLDGSTPAQNAARELLPHLPNGHQVVLREFGHTTDFWNTQPEAGTHLISRFFDTGEVDTSQFTHHPIDFTPGKTYGSVARGIADAMIGLAIATIVSLVLMGLRIRKHDRLGRRTSIAVRSIYPAVLGLGGWFAGALAAMVAFPALPVDAMGLVVASVAAPIALGIYYAWFDRAQPTATRRAGLALAVVGALAGAWLGFACADSPFAVLTTIAGAAAGANLALIARDIATAAAD
jgi:pimeloyl-ACP methyl ester carboxylesterase